MDLFGFHPVSKIAESTTYASIVKQRYHYVKETRERELGCSTTSCKTETLLYRWSNLLL